MSHDWVVNLRDLYFPLDEILEGVLAYCKVQELRDRSNGRHCLFPFALILHFLICKMELITPTSWMNCTKGLAHRDTANPSSAPPSFLPPPFAPCPQHTPCQLPFSFSTDPSSMNSLLTFLKRYVHLNNSILLASLCVNLYLACRKSIGLPPFWSWSVSLFRAGWFW